MAENFLHPSDVDGAERSRRRGREDEATASQSACKCLRLPADLSIKVINGFSRFRTFSPVLVRLACGVSVSEILLSISCTPSIKIALFKPQNRKKGEQEEGELRPRVVPCINNSRAASAKLKTAKIVRL